MNVLFRACLNSMMYFFLRICAGYPSEYMDEISEWAYIMNKVLSERGWTGTTHEFINMLQVELDEGCYREAYPNFLATMEREFGGIGLDALLKVVRGCFLNTLDCSDTNDGE